MVNSHADMLVPGSKESRLAQARNSASCTRSSARSTFPHSEIANARNEGTAASIASRTDLFGGAIRPLILVFSVGTGFIGLVQPAEDFGEPIRNALIYHLPVHCAELLSDPGLE